MKRVQALTAVLVILAFLPSLDARANLSMIILSETYHVHGSVTQTEGEDWYGQWWPAVSLSYTETGGTGAGGEVEHNSPLMYALSHARRGVNWDEPQTNGFNLSLGAYTSEDFPYEGESCLYAYAYASVEVDFMVRGADDFLMASRMGEAFKSQGGDSLAEVTNLNTSESWALSASSLIPINETDAYRLKMWAYEYFSYGTEISLEFQNVSEMATVPLPGAALLGVLGLGYGGVRLRRHQ